MKTLAILVLGLVTFDAAMTAPTLESINYDSETYDATLEDLDNLYNYENIPVDQVEVIDSPTVEPFKCMGWGMTGVCSLQIDVWFF